MWRFVQRLVSPLSISVRYAACFAAAVAEDSGRLTGWLAVRAMPTGWLAVKRLLMRVLEHVARYVDATHCAQKVVANVDIDVRASAINPSPKEWHH